MQDSQKKIEINKSAQIRGQSEAVQFNNVEKDSREDPSLSRSLTILFNRSSRNLPTANFESNEWETSPSPKQQGMILALLRSFKLWMKKCRIRKKNYKIKSMKSAKE